MSAAASVSAGPTRPFALSGCCTRAIGIDLDRDPRTGDVVIGRCAFSRIYTPAVCEFVSALDAGICRGLTGGTTLVFTARITEGAPACRARLVGSARA